MLFSIKGILTAISAMLVLIVSLIASYETAPPADISLGAIPGIEISGNEFIIGGASLISEKQIFNNRASTTLCSFKLPNATTTPIAISAKLTGNSGGTELLIGTSATSTTGLENIFARRVGAAGFTGDLIATSTPALFSDTEFGTFSPNARINIGLTSATTATGTCAVLLQAL